MSSIIQYQEWDVFKSLSELEKKLFIKIFDYLLKHKKLFIKNSDLAEQFECTERAIQIALSNLELACFIFRHSPYNPETGVRERTITLHPARFKWTQEKRRKVVVPAEYVRAV